MSTFVNFNLDEDIVDGVDNKVTYAMWDGLNPTLTQFFTSSAQIPNDSENVGKYYLDVYNENPQTSTTAEVMFSVAYGNVGRGGALSTDEDYPTLSIYNSYRNVLLSSPSTKFNIGTDIDSAMFISIKRSLLKQRLDPGNWELKVGSMLLIDDSGDANNTLGTYSDYYYIVSGSIADGAYNTTKLGIVYPNNGIIVLNAALFSSQFTFNNGVDSYKNNHANFITALNTGANFTARSMETVSSTYYFVRVKNKQFNYSSNPTFYSGSLNTVLYDDFVNDPKTFITSVGMYNDQNDLVAVAKLSQPIKKSFSNEVTIQTRLDF